MLDCFRIGEQGLLTTQGFVQTVKPFFKAMLDLNQIIVQVCLSCHSVKPVLEVTVATRVLTAARANNFITAEASGGEVATRLLD